MGGLAVVVVIVLAVVITVLVMRPSGGGGVSPTPTNGNSGFASANDTGPVNIIVEDPTCEAWGRVAREYSDVAQKANWGDRNAALPANVWTPEQRTMYETVSKAMIRAADQTVNLVTQTPHRVMRELYEQFIAYAHSFADKIPSYVPEDDDLAVVTDTITTATANVCSAIDYRSAPPIAPLVPHPNPPSGLAPLGDPTKPERFLTSGNSVCADWDSAAQKNTDDTADWRGLDGGIPASDWTPEQRAINDKVVPIMSAYADELERLGRRSGNPTLEDFAVLAAQYQRAYVVAIPTYTSADNFLVESAIQLVRAINWACKAAT